VADVSDVRVWEGREGGGVKQQNEQCRCGREVRHWLCCGVLKMLHARGEGVVPRRHEDVVAFDGQSSDLEVLLVWYGRSLHHRCTQRKEANHSG
jgi:hypothetical protein